MSNVKLFGDKRKFAIEVGETSNKTKFNLRFWINDNSIGHFKRSGSLSNSFKEFRRFIDNKEQFYLDLFDDLPPNRIYYYLLDMSLLMGSDSDHQEFYKRAKFHLHFGVQFSTYTSAAILLYRNDKVIFLLPQKGGGEIKMIDVSFAIFYDVVQEYLSFYEAQ